MKGRPFSSNETIWAHIIYVFINNKMSLYNSRSLRFMELSPVKCISLKHVNLSTCLKDMYSINTWVVWNIRGRVLGAPPAKLIIINYYFINMENIIRENLNHISGMPSLSARRDKFEFLVILIMLLSTNVSDLIIRKIENNFGVQLAFKWLKHNCISLT